MKRILYSKYSNERAMRFQVRTDIVEDEEGVRYARKVPCTDAAQAHIDNIFKWSKKLDETYAGSMLRANHAFVQPDGLYFDYIEGKTFEEHLDELLKNEDYSAVLSEIQRFFDMLKSTLQLKHFQSTEAFAGVFGEIAFPQVLLAADINNIDYLFGNIFMGKDLYTIIDYEWTFDFPIPFLYIVYRTVHYYTYDRSREKLRELGLLRLLGISKELEECFTLMEHRFQLYILGETTPVINMYPDIAGPAFMLDHMVARERESYALQQIQVYYDQGRGFSEADSVVLHAKGNEAGGWHYLISPKQAKRLRIDTGSQCCIVNNIRILANGAEYARLPFTGNGYPLTQDSYLFLTTDPQIILENLPQQLTQIKFSCQIEQISEEAAAEIQQFIGKYKNQMKQSDEALEALTQHNREMQDELQLYRSRCREAEERSAVLAQQLEQIQATFCGKLLRLRSFIKRVLKKILGVNPNLYKAARYLRIYGPIATVKRIKIKLTGEDVPAEEWEVTKAGRRKQRKHVFANPVKFSIVVPLYNTPEAYLNQMIDSVLDQTYGNWELCMADGSDEDHKHVEEICRAYAERDARIRYRKLKINEGISENTNRCLEMAEGDYIGLFDHDDLLHPAALYENMCVIDASGADFIYSDENTFSETPKDAYCPHFKPDYSPDTLRSYNYICHFTVFKKSLMDQVGMFRKEFDGSQDYDMILRLTEQAKKIVHIPKILYYWRAHAASVASDISAKTYCIDAAKKALAEHLERVGLKGQVGDASIPSVYKIQYEIENEPLISILIPNKDHTDDLDLCIRSITERSTYRNFEIIIIENNSEEAETFAYYKKIETNPQVQVVYWQGEFNYSAINNFGVTYAKGDYFLLLNNDIEVITPDWLQEMLMFAQRSDVGAVGAKLYYPDDTIQHAGIILGLGGLAGHSHKYFPRDAYGYSSRLQLAQNLSGVTAACMMIPREVYEKVGGLDEGYKVAFNDVDLCMKIRQEGYLIIFTPFAELYHYESKSRGYEDSPEKVERFNREIKRFHSKWKPQLEAGDPYYNNNLTLDSEDFARKKPGEPDRIHMY